MLGAALYGPRGVVAGMGIGSLIFGALGILLARRTVDRLEEAVRGGRGQTSPRRRPSARRRCRRGTPIPSR